MELLDIKALGREIKEGRIREGLNQDQMAEELAITSRYYSDIENAVRLPGLKLLFTICKRFNISLDNLIFSKDHVHKSSIRRRIEGQLDTLDDKDLVIVESTADGIIKSKNT